MWSKGFRSDILGFKDLFSACTRITSRLLILAARITLYVAGSVRYAQSLKGMIVLTFSSTLKPFH